MISWRRLWKIADVESFVSNIDCLRNDENYINLMKVFNLSKKVERCEEWLKKVRTDAFIKMAKNRIHLRQDPQQYPQKSSPLAREWLSRSHTPFEEEKTRTRNTHIMIRKSKESSPLLIGLLEKHNILAMKRLQQLKDSLSRLASDGEFGAED